MKGRHLLSSVIFFNMIYAPVAVTTLNRYEHLKELIDSLEKNTWVEYTDLIISLDYPPNEKYVEGYEKNKKYLQSKKRNNKFRKVTIFEQDKNLGSSKNSRWLKEYMIQNYDRWITAEDDVVFAPNFLMYIDKGLELFEDDYTVQAICGCHDLDKISHNGNVIKQVWYHPHGNATWKNKYIKLKDNCYDILLNPDNYSIASILDLFFHSKFLFQYYICNVLCDRTGCMWINEKELKLFDIIETLYNYYTKSCCVVPIKYKSHSCGFDGSGVSELRLTDSEKEWPLDSEKMFEYDVPNPFVVEKKSYKALDKCFKVGGIYLLYVWFQYLVFRLSGNNWKTVHNMVIRIRKILKKENNTMSNYS